MKLSDFDFELPNELIALRPVHPRSSSKLLVSKDDKIIDDQFLNLLKYLKKGDRLVLNDTKVIPAKLHGKRIRHSDNGRTTANIGINLLSTNNDGHWLALAKPAKRVNVGEIINFDNEFTATGGRGAETIEEIRENAIATHGAQNRAVTKKDYEVRALAMDTMFGGVAKVYVEQDGSIDTNAAQQVLRNPSVKKDFNDASWVGYRLAEILPIELSQKQIYLEIEEPFDRLELLNTFMKAMNELRHS